MIGWYRDGWYRDGDYIDGDEYLRGRCNQSELQRAVEGALYIATESLNLRPDDQTTVSGRVTNIDTTCIYSHHVIPRKIIKIISE